MKSKITLFGSWRTGALSWFLLLWPAAVFLAYLPQIGNSFPFITVVFNAWRFPDPGWSARIPVLMGSLWIILVSTALFAVILNLGRRVRTCLGVELAEAWVRPAFDLGLGILLLDLFWIGSGLNVLWFKPLWWVLFAGMGSLLLFDLVRARSELKGVHLSWPGKERPGFSVLLLLVCASFYFLFAFGTALVPETFYDSMLYHLAIPQDWLAFHGVRDLPLNFCSNFPYGAELYFLNGLVFQGTEAAKMLHVLCLTTAAFLAAGWARESSGKLAGNLTLGFCVTLPLLNLNVWTTQVEGVLTLFVVLFFYGLTRIFRSGLVDKRWALLVGLFGGMAFTVKYTAILALAAGLIAYGVALRPKPKSFLKVLGWLVLAGLLVVLPWVLKNLVFTGDPVFPYAPHWFEGRHLPLEGYEKLLAEEKDDGAQGAWGWLSMPWKLVMAAPDNYYFVGPLALALVPFVLLARRKGGALKFLGWGAAIYFVTGFALTRTLRFISPVFFLFYILAGTWLGHKERAPWAKGFAFLGAIAAILCFFNMAAIHSTNYFCAGVWSGREERDAFTVRDKTTAYLPMARWVSSNLPSDARLLIVGDSRGLYYDRPFLSQSFFDEQLLPRLAKGTSGPDGMAAGLRKLGIDYVAVNGKEGERVAENGFTYDLTRDQWKGLNDFFWMWLEPVHYNGAQAVYRVRKEKASQETFVENPVLFFSAPVARLVKDNKGRNPVEAEKDMEEVLKLYDFSPFWWERKAQLKGRLGKKAEEFEAYSKAADLGPLHRESYPRWLSLSKELGKRKASLRIRKEALKWQRLDL